MLRGARRQALADNRQPIGGYPKLISGFIEVAQQVLAYSSLQSRERSAGLLRANRNS